MNNWIIIAQSYSDSPPVSWLVLHSITKRSHTCETLEEAEVIAKALNEMEEE